jgi:hypothetical protein
LRRNCPLQHTIKEKLKVLLEVTGIQGRRSKQLLDNFKDRREFWKLKEEAQDRCLWGRRLGQGYGPAVRQTLE